MVREKTVGAALMKREHQLFPSGRPLDEPAEVVGTHLPGEFKLRKNTFLPFPLVLQTRFKALPGAVLGSRVRFSVSRGSPACLAAAVIAAAALLRVTGLWLPEPLRAPVPFSAHPAVPKETQTLGLKGHS